MDKTVQELIEISASAAQHPRLVQGGGGNCSVKSSRKMWVKASGYFLEDVSFNQGYAILDLATGTIFDESRGKPSMETPLHTLLGSYVIHTHPIAVAALVSSQEGKGAMRKIFSETGFVWVNYAAPGIQIFETVKKNLTAEMISEDLVLFLENHGLFVSSSSKKQVMNLHEHTVQRLESFFGKTEKIPQVPENHYLTPDHAVYTHRQAGSSGKKKVAHDETLFLAQRALSLMENKGWTPKWLSSEEVQSILGLDEEKYRQQLWGES